MGIASRIIRIFKADLNGVMDQLEDPGLLLKQYLRDMEEALNQKKAQLARKIALRDRLQKEHDRYNRQYQALDRDLTVALQEGKDDLARMLIRKIKPLGGLLEELDGRVTTLDEEVSRFKEHLSELGLQYEQLCIRCAEYFHRTETLVRENHILDITPEIMRGEFSEDEIELELLKRKQGLTPN